MNTYADNSQCFLYCISSPYLRLEWKHNSRNPAADAQSGTLDIGKTLGTQDIIFGDEEEENDEDLSDEEEDEGG